jgi:mRNA-decapping enzyme 1B
MNESVRKAANLKLLTRTCDATTQDILASSAHVVLYEFTGAAWTKMGVEGSVFLTAKSNDTYDCIILNRNTPENFKLSVTKDLQIQHQPPYLIVKVPATSHVLGIWFTSIDEQQEFYNVLQQTVERLRNSPPPPPPSSAVPEVSKDPLANIDHEATALLASKLLLGVATNVATATSDIEEPLAFSSPPPSMRNNSTASTSTQTPVATPSSASTAPTPPRHGSPSGTGVALDKKSLQLALLSLIQDDRFLDLLHSQYLRVVHSRAKTKRDGEAGNSNK